MHSKTKLWILLFLSVVIIGFSLRLDGLQRALEYDEIWPLRQFQNVPVWEIIVTTDPQLPNNFHPITHYIASLYASSPEQILEWKYRLWSLFWGIMLLPMVALYTFHFTKSILCAFIALLFCSLDPHLIHFSHTMRGYSLQHFWVVFFCYWLFHQKLPEQKPYVWSLVTIISLLILQGSIVTSVLIWGPLTGIFCLQHIYYWYSKKITRQKLIKTIAAPIAGCFIALFWLWITYPVLSQGTQHKVTYKNWIDVPFLSIGSLLPMHLHILWIIGIFLIHRENYCFHLLATMGTVLAFIWLTGLLGPARVYIYLLPLMALPCSFVIHTICKRWQQHTNLSLLVTILFFAVTAHFHIPQQMQKLKDIDYLQVIPKTLEAQQATPNYLVFSPHSGFVLSNYFPQINTHNMHYLLTPRKTLSIHAIYPAHENHHIAAFDLKNQTAKFLDLPQHIKTQTINGVTHAPWKAKKVSRESPQTGGVLFAVAKVYHPKAVEQLHRFLKQQEAWLVVNFILTQPITENNQTKVAYLICAEIHSVEQWHQVTRPFHQIDYYWLPR